MNYDFETYLLGRLINIKDEIDENFNVFVSDEQAFVKQKDFGPKSIYVIVKKLASDIEFDGIIETMPIQLIVISEGNSMDVAKEIMERFANQYNWKMIDDGTIHVKQQYSSPVVLSNFNEVGYEYRSVLYVSGTLYVMQNIVDVKNLTIDGLGYIPLAFSINYSMSTNTQQLPASGNETNYIAKSLKTVSTFSLAITLPMIDTSVVYKVMEILNEQKSGNEDFAISFVCDGLTISKIMRLTSVQIITAPNQVPSLQLGFMK